MIIGQLNSRYASINHIMYILINIYQRYVIIWKCFLKKPR